MVLLSGLDSNKYRTALAFKKYIAEHPEVQPAKNILGDAEKCNREIDEFGEVSVNKIRQPQKRLSQEEIQMLITEYQSGKEPAELGERFGIHRITASKILKRNNIPLRNTCPRISKV